MKIGTFAGKLTTVLTAILAASTLLFAVDTAAWAQRGGGHAGVAGGGFRGGAVGGARGGAVGGFRGGPGFRGYGYGYGWRRAPGWGWWWGGWGWPLGVYLSVLPWYYSTFWWDGIPYYYANGGYYLWNGNVGQYEQVQPPPEVSEQTGSAPPAGAAPPPAEQELFAYPKNGQSAEQQASDKSACRAWAMSQIVAGAGAEPAPPPGTSGPAPPAAAAPPATAGQHQDYLRAEAACLEARGYSVE